MSDTTQPMTPQQCAVPSLGSLSGVVTKTDTVSHILCWVDGTDEACRAAECAAGLAKNLGAGLTYVAVGDEPEPNAGFEDFARIEDVSEPMTPTLEGNARACLHRAATIAARTGVHCAAQLVHAGKPADAICATAQSQGADLVVIRKCDTGLFKRFLTTSVSEALVNQCNFAVLSVR